MGSRTPPQQHAMRTTALIPPGLARAALLVALTVSSGCTSDRAPSNPVIPVPAVARVSVTPASASVDVGATVQLAAVVYDAAGNPLQGRSITWSSSANTIASVTAAGTVAGIAPGTATITAVAEGRQGSSEVTVLPPVPAVVARISVTPASASVTVGGTAQLTAVAYDSAGAVLLGKTIAWSSSATTVASVTATGTVTGISAGAATITAAAEGKQATATVTVLPPAPSLGTITVNGAQQFQTMSGWEALAEIGQAECDPRAYQTYKNEVLDRAANEVGINRIRVGLRNGYENPIDQFLNFKAGQLTFNQWKVFWFQVVNDNIDPFVINPAGFNWGYLDYTMDELVVPLKQRLAARGESFWLNLSYTGANSGDLHRDSPDEYAEFVLAAFQHLQQKYGWVPNSLEIVNEPNLGTWSASHVGLNLVAAKRRLNQAGFFPDFVGPSGSKIGDSIQYFDAMMLISGVPQALNEFAYHRYGTIPTQSQLRNVGQRGAQYGMRTAMLEHGGSGHDDLHEDLTLANVSAWQQFGLAFCSDQDGGGVYLPIYGAKLGQNTPSVQTGRLTKYLRQYFRYVALRAVRVGATTSDARFAPVAFRNVNGKYVAVVKASAAGSFTVGGLPAGTYGIDYTTDSDYMRALPDVTISGAQALATSIPAAGVITIFAR